MVEGGLGMGVVVLVQEWHTLCSMCCACCGPGWSCMQLR